MYWVNYFISNVLTSQLLGDVADFVGNNNNNSWRFAESLIKSLKSDYNFHVQLAFLRKNLQHKYKVWFSW